MIAHGAAAFNVSNLPPTFQVAIGVRTVWRVSCAIERYANRIKRENNQELLHVLRQATLAAADYAIGATNDSSAAALEASRSVTAAKAKTANKAASTILLVDSTAREIKTVQAFADAASVGAHACLSNATGNDASNAAQAASYAMKAGSVSAELAADALCERKVDAAAIIDYARLSAQFTAYTAYEGSDAVWAEAAAYEAVEAVERAVATDMETARRLIERGQQFVDPGISGSLGAIWPTNS